MMGCLKEGTMVLNDRQQLKDILAQERSNWGWIVALGALILICGVLILGNLVAATIFSMVLVATFMLFGGVFRFMLAFRARSWGRFFYWALAGLLYIAAGAIVLMDPLKASVIFTFIISVLLVFAGGIRIWLGFGMRPDAGWIWIIFAIGWPANSIWLIGMLLGIELVIEGWGFLMLGLALRAMRSE
jgi:uncharacterized membrane protein HdeD (DUF308 family)